MSVLAKKSWAIAVAFVLLSLTRAQADILNVQIAGNTVTAEIELPGGIDADLTLEYESVSNLSLSNLGLTATLVNPTDPTLLARMPNLQTSVPVGFPVLISISPDVASSFAFEGVATIELYTADLHFVAGSPLRIFSAKNGGVFKDITVMNAGGSYRTRGGGGHYSDFLIVADLRSLSTAITQKLDALDALLLAHQSHFSFANYVQISGYATAARNAWAVGEIDDAIDALNDLDDKLKDWSELDSVPHTWAAAGGTPNVAGELRAAAQTLRFSLTEAANSL